MFIQIKQIYKTLVDSAAKPVGLDILIIPKETSILLTISKIIYAML